jgi:hypothetical protein
MDDTEGKKNYPYQDSNSYPSAIKPIASSYTDCIIPAVMYFRDKAAGT